MLPFERELKIVTKKTSQVEVLADILKLGGVVVFPTETVYGIGASSLNHEACKKIYTIKKRPHDNPLIVHCFDLAQAEEYAYISHQARILWERFAPGPLTLIVNKKSESVFSSGLPTLALRIPASKGIREILKILGSPISAPSANLSGRPSITRQEDAIREFEGKVEGILLESLDSEVRPYTGLESTVLDLTCSYPRILRPGSIEKEELEEVLGLPISVPEDPECLSPGTKYRHYSPEGQVRIFASIEEIISMLQPQNPILEQISILHYRERILPKSWQKKIHSVSVADNEDYARNLYAFFLDSDKQGKTYIFCEFPRPGKLHRALKDRLWKAMEK